MDFYKKLTNPIIRDTIYYGNVRGRKEAWAREVWKEYEHCRILPKSRGQRKRRIKSVEK